jgi:hypothetical protein
MNRCKGMDSKPVYSGFPCLTLLSHTPGSTVLGKPGKMAGQFFWQPAGGFCNQNVELARCFGYNARPVYPANAEYSVIHTLVHVGVSLKGDQADGWKNLTLNDWSIKCK